MTLYTPMHATPLYAAGLAVVFIALSVRTIRLRRSLQIALGDSDDERMVRAMRVHANFAEYVPFTLLLMLMLELAGGDGWHVHVIGACLVVGRLSHAFGVSRSPEDYRFRVLGMVLTFGALVSSALGVLVAYARAAIA